MGLSNPVDAAGHVAEKRRKRLILGGFIVLVLVVAVAVYVLRYAG
jgi:hypothetical protein